MTNVGTGSSVASGSARYLKRLFSDRYLYVHVTKKETTIANSADVFNGQIDSNFGKLGNNNQGVDTAATLIEWYEIQAGKNYAEVFNSLGNRYDPVFEQGQIVEICNTWAELLPHSGASTFFLFHCGIKTLVANVYRDGKKISVAHDHLRSGPILETAGRHRIVVPASPHIFS